MKIKNVEEFSPEDHPRCAFCTGFEQKIDSATTNPEVSPVIEKLGEFEKQKIISEFLALFESHENLDHETMEQFFDNIKYQVTEYVLKHEFNSDHNLSVQLTLWLDKCRNPDSFEALQEMVINTYLKPQEFPFNFKKL